MAFSEHTQHDLVPQKAKLATPLIPSLICFYLGTHGKNMHLCYGDSCSGPGIYASYGGALITALRWSLGKGSAFAFCFLKLK